jgi:hypothetical protein
VAVLALRLGVRDLVEITFDPMYHHHREDELGANGYLSVNRDN